MGILPPKIGVALVGYGYWGPNLARNLVESPDLRLRILCDSSERRRAAFEAKHPGIDVETDFDRVLLDPRIEAVVIATPPSTHYALVRRGLEAGKHVLVEKPLARTESQARELVELAAGLERTLMPGHTFLYSPSVNKVRDLIRDGTLGEPYFVTSSRMNLGNYQPDGVVCDLAPHDLSILLHWLDEPVVQVAATGCSVFQSDVPETAFISLRFASGAAANVQISWLAPRKMRQMVVVGSKRMIQYEDTSADESVRVYDRGLEFDQPENFGEYRLTYRTGDMVAPRIEAAEPLALEMRDFARAIRTGEEPLSNARLGLEIVRAMDAASLSLRLNGAPVDVGVSKVGAGTVRPSRNGNGNGHSNGGHGSNGNGHSNGGNHHRDAFGVIVPGRLGDHR
jgi:predicted dehydrogenase